MCLTLRGDAERDTALAMRRPRARGLTLGAIAKRHFTIPVLNRCGADVVNAHAGLDLTAAWGDLSPGSGQVPAHAGTPAHCRVR